MKNIANIVLNDFTNDSRVLKTSNSLIQFGYKVTVVAMHGKGLVEKEMIGDINVDRVNLTSRSWPKYKPIQLLKYFEFVCRAFWRYKSVDIIHCNDLSALPVGLLIKLLGKDVKVVYDCHEYETEIHGLKGLEKKVKKNLERLLIRFSDQVITVSDSIADEYVRLYGIPKPRLVLNCPPYQRTAEYNIFRETFGIREDQHIFLYQGGLSKGRGIEILLEVFEKLSSDKNVLVCMGYGPLKGLIEEKSKLSNIIYFHPAVSPQVLLKYTSSADYGIAFIEDTCLSYRYCLPNKIFEYMMAGLPLLVSNVFEMKRFVETHQVGIVARENSLEGFIQAVKTSIDQNYIETVENVIKARSVFCWRTQEEVLKEVYRDIS
ncbi:glycosyltransferase [Porticoccaceae bacterium]|nr:glycosyltransferase [Porticoccaceae bacterium]